MLEQFNLVPHVSKTVSPGDVFGRLTILAIGKKPGTYRYTAVCRCECGSINAVRLDGVVRGGVLSCGCLHKERSTTHGLTKHPLFNVWKNMLARCQNPSCRSYSRYGARGISVCDRWLSIENFVADMEGTYAAGNELDRIDNNGNYEPSNCRWATRSQNADNRRSGRMLTYNGKTQSITRWADDVGISVGTLWDRIAVWKWPVERALTTPPIPPAERMAMARASNVTTKQ